MEKAKLDYHKLIKITVICACLLVVGTGSAFAVDNYINDSLSNKGYNNTKDIWIGSWQDPYFIMIFHDECNQTVYTDIGSFQLGHGERIVSFFTKYPNIPECTYEDIVNEQWLRTQGKDPYDSSGICTFEFNNADVVKSKSEYGGIEGVYDTKLTMTTEFSVPLKCFKQITNSECEWVYLNQTGWQENYCQLTDELENEGFYGLAKFFTTNHEIPSKNEVK